MCTLPTHFSILGISTYHLVTREKPYVDRHKKQVEHLLLLCTTLLPTQYVKVSMEKYNFLFDASSENMRTYLVILLNWEKIIYVLLRLVDFNDFTI